MTYLRLRSLVLTMTVCAPLACGDDVGAEGPGSEGSSGSSDGSSSSGTPADSSSSSSASSSDSSSSGGSSSEGSSSGGSSSDGSSSDGSSSSSSSSDSEDPSITVGATEPLTSSGPGSESSGDGGPSDCACMAGEYCDWPDEMCGDGLDGVCLPIPVVCDDVLAPVCGCDGEDYVNECEAAALGIDVAYDGMCAEDTCDCVAGEYCELAPGQCVGEDGVCEEMPFACNELYAPVCGCDGVTYTNECFAAGAGVNVDYDGTC